MADEFLREGMHDIEAERYHADPCESPSASKSTLHTIIDKTPLHAWNKHPRLNLKAQQEHSNKFNIGTAAHAVLTGRGNRIALIEADEYKTNAAKAARDEAYKRGATPVLREQWERVHEMVAVASKELARHTDAAALTDKNGLPEQTLIWREGETWCRCRPDWINISRRLILDYKTTESADPANWCRNIFYDLGYDMQRSWYTRGARAVLQERKWEFWFIVQESKAPYALSVVDELPVTLEYGDQRVGQALHIFQHCMKTKDWPGYPPFRHFAEVPDWRRTQWEERKHREKLLEELRAEQESKRLPKPAKTKRGPDLSDPANLLMGG